MNARLIFVYKSGASVRLSKCSNSSTCEMFVWPFPRSAECLGLGFVQGNANFSLSLSLFPVLNCSRVLLASPFHLSSSRDGTRVLRGISSLPASNCRQREPTKHPEMLIVCHIWLEVGTNATYLLETVANLPFVNFKADFLTAPAL